MSLSAIKVGFNVCRSAGFPGSFLHRTIPAGDKQNDADIKSTSLLKQFFLAPVFLFLLAEVLRHNVSGSQ